MAIGGTHKFSLKLFIFKVCLVILSDETSLARAANFLHQTPIYG
jgi:hypothetical protein